MKSIFNLGLLFSAVVFFSGQAQATLIYSNDFEGAIGSEWSTTATSYDNDTTTFLGRFGNQTATLNLTGIGAHSTVTVSFDLILWDSWDGDNTRWGRDFQGLNADNARIYEYTFSSPGFNVSSTNPDSTPDLTGYFGGNRRWQDALYKNFNDGFRFNHFSSTLTLDFYGRHLQRLGDESWGIDNVRVYTDNNASPVPEPTTLLLFGAGLVGLAGMAGKIKLKK